MKTPRLLPAVAGLAIGLTTLAPLGAATASVTLTDFGQTAQGEAVHLYSLVNSTGMKADITDYGAIIVRLCVPDREGRLGDVVLGYNSVGEYIQGSPYFGAVVGRYGNRIAHGKFSLDGADYTLATNNSPGGIPCHLHGGVRGFDKVVWRAIPFVEHNQPGLELHYLSKDGEEGYPGDLDVTVRYLLTDENELAITYRATTDKATPVNLTQHSYFNLRGEGSGDILSHVLTFAASRLTEVDAGLIPTGKILAVKGTPFDFTSPHAIGERVDSKDEQMVFGGGYDHNWVLDHAAGRLSLAATAFEPVSGRVMEVWTDQPGLQFYCGNFLDGSNVGKSGRPYNFRNGFCLETQHFPDSPNHPAFPSTILRPGEVYSTRTVYKFSAR